MIMTSEKDTQALSFKLNGKEFAIPLDYVQEIASSKTIMLMSQEPSAQQKIINHKGQNIPIINIVNNEPPKGSETCKDNEQFIIILNHEDQKAGILADEVSEVVFIPNSNIKQPEGFMDEVQEYIYGIGKVNNSDLFLLNPTIFISKLNKDYIGN